MARTVFQQDHGLSAYRWVVAEAGKYRHAQPGESPEGFVVSVGGPSRFVVETAGEVKLPPGILTPGAGYTVGTDGALVVTHSTGYGEATRFNALKLTPTVSVAGITGSGGGDTIIVPDRFPNFYTDVSVGTLTLDNGFAGDISYSIPVSGTAPTLEGSQTWTGQNTYATSVSVNNGAAITTTTATSGNTVYVGGGSVAASNTLQSSKVLVQAGTTIDTTIAPAVATIVTASGGSVEAGTDVSTGGVLRVHGTTDVISMGSGAYGAPIVIYYNPAVQTHGSALSWSYSGYQIGEIGYDTTVVGGTPVFRITTEANQPSGAPSKDIEVCPGSIRQIVSRNTSISMLGPVYVGSASTTPARTLDVGGTFRASGNSTIGGTFGVTGATTLSSTLAVTDTATFSNSANVTGSVTATAQIVGGTSSSTGLGVWSMGIARFSGTTTSSAPSVWANGPWYTGAMPLAVFGDFTTGTWSSDGTGVGINTPSTFTGNILDLQKNGASKLAVSTTLATVNVPLQMANATADPGTEGSLFWDPNDHTLAIRPDILGSTLQVGQEMWVRVVNKTGSLIPDGTVVYINGAQGNRPTVTAAIATSTNADRTIGVVTSDIADNAEGLVTIIGTVHGYNTSSFTTGDVLYLSGTTAGALTNVRPTAPTHAVRVGYALNSTNNGSILVALHTGDALADLHDTVLTSPASTDILQYDGTVWRNVPIGTVTSLDTLSDVTITSPTTGQIVRYNGSQWVNAAPDSLTTLDALTDVTITSPTSGQSIRYNGTEWQNYTPNLDSLTDVTITSPTLHQSVRYDGSGWVNYSPTVDSLIDTAIISPSVNQFLRYNGSNWVNAGVTIPTDLDSLTDTVITSPLSGHVLRYDGTSWKNIYPTSGRTILDFGVAGDGTDESSAVQSAINTMVSAGLPVIFPPSTTPYRFAQVAVPSNAFIYGVGARIEHPNGFSTGTSRRGVFELTSVSDVVIRGLRFAPYASTDSTTFIRADASSNFAISDCYMEEYNTAAIILRACTDFKIRDCHIRCGVGGTSLGVGIRIFGNSERGDVDDCVIEGYKVTKNAAGIGVQPSGDKWGSVAIACDISTDWATGSNLFKSIAGTSTLTGATSVTITDSQIVDPTRWEGGAAVSFNTTLGYGTDTFQPSFTFASGSMTIGNIPTSFSGKTLSYSGMSYENAPRHINIRGCLIRGMAYAGISIITGRDITCTDNTIEHIGDLGFDPEGTQRCKLLGGSVYDCSTAAAVLIGGGCVIQGVAIKTNGDNNAHGILCGNNEIAYQGYTGAPCPPLRGGCVVDGVTIMNASPDEVSTWAMALYVPPFSTITDVSFEGFDNFGSLFKDGYGTKVSNVHATSRMWFDSCVGLTVQNCECIKSRQHNFVLDSCQKFVVDHCTVKYTYGGNGGGTGLTYTGCTNGLIRDCTFTDMTNYSFVVVDGGGNTSVTVSGTTAY